MVKVISNTEKYAPALLMAARREGWSAAEVEAFGYAQVAQHCGVVLKPNGDSPPDFFYRSVQSHASNVLRQEHVGAELANVRETMESLLKDSPLLKHYGVTVDVDGKTIDIPPQAALEGGG